MSGQSSVVQDEIIRVPGRNYLEDNLKCNLDAWRLILILLVVLNHIFVMRGDSGAGGAASRVGVVLTLAAVPSLSAFSGYLFSQSRAQKPSIVIGKKLRSLVAPFLLWNTAAFLAFLAFNETFELWPTALIENRSQYWLVNSLTAFHGEPADAPLYFLRDLFICFLVLASIRPVLEDARGWLLVFGLVLANYAFAFDGRIIIRDTIPVFFLIGVGLQKNPGVKRFCAALVAPLVVLAVVLLSLWGIGDMRWGRSSLLEFTTLLTFAALVFGLAQLLPPDSNLCRWGRQYSFVIFLSHWWVLAGLNWSIGRLGLPKGLLYMAGIPAAVAVGVGLAMLIRTLPRPLAAAAAGGRA